MYRIEFMYDSYDCETCGGDYAEGYQIYKDGVMVVDKHPVAHCYDGNFYNQDEAYKDILKLEGVLIEVEYREEEE